MEDLFETLSISQYFFQLILLIVLVIFSTKKYINVKSIKIPLFFLAPQAISLLTYKISIVTQNEFLTNISFLIFMIFNFFNIFDPVLIYLLNLIAKGKLLVDNKKEYK